LKSCGIKRTIACASLFAAGYPTNKMLRIFCKKSFSAFMVNLRRLESWIYQIARNRVIDHYRRQRHWVDLPETLIIEDEDEEEPIEKLLPYLWESVEELPDAYREALILADLQGIAQQDLADKLGITYSGAKSRVQRARQKVKESMLNCFDFEFDARGQVMDYRKNC